MTLNSSGPLSMGGATTGQSINLELGVSATALADINSTSFRTLAGVASGQISISNFYGKSNTPTYFVSSISNSGTVAANLLASVNASSGNTYIAAQYYSTASLYITKISSAGAEVWTTLISGAFSSNQFFNAIQEDSSGNVYFATAFDSSACFFYKLNSTGTLQFQYRYVGSSGSFSYPSLTLTPTGTLYFSYLTSYGANNFIVAKVDNTGTVIWGNAYSGPYPYLDPGSFPMSYDSSDNVYIAPTGYIFSITSPNSSASTFWKLSSSTGAISYAKLINPTNATRTQTVYGMYSSPAGELYIGLRVATAPSATYPYPLIKLTTAGALSWALGSTTTTSKLSAGLSGDGVYSSNYGGTVSSSGTVGTLYSTGFETKCDGAQSLTLLPSYGSQYPWAAIKTSASNNLLGSLAISCPSPATTSRLITSTAFYGANTTQTIVSGSITSLFGANTDLTVTVTAQGITRTATSATTSSITLGLTTTNLTTATGSSNNYRTPGTYSWVAPAGVTSVSVVCVGGGQGGGAGYVYGGYYGGIGGSLGFKNNYAVTAGSSYTVVVGAGGTAQAGFNDYQPATPAAGPGGNSYFVSTTLVRGGGGGQSGGSVWLGDGGGYGGPGSTVIGSFNGGGGAGGYAGTAASPTAGNGGSGTSGTSGAGAGTGGAAGGGAAYNVVSSYQGQGGLSGGGVGIMGQGNSGVGGNTSSAPTSGSYGLGASIGSGGGQGGASFTCAGCCSYYTWNGGYSGGGGAVRIVWPGSTRTFPSTNVGAL